MDESGAMCDHIQGFTLGPYLLDVDELTRPPYITDHQGVPVVVTVKIKLYATGPFVLNCPQNTSLVLLIKWIVYINKEEPPILFL